MRFSKYHALGNDYLVLDPPEWIEPPKPAQIQALCHRHYGVGSDGVLFGPIPSKAARFGLRIFNPDGSEAEKSGNGLRIFSRYLWDQGLVREEEFLIETPGGSVRARVFEQGRQVQVDMGTVSFWSDRIPVTGPRREVIDEPLEADGRSWNICAATIGNPHCVIPVPEATADLARRVGPQIEGHEIFPRRTNVQFMQVLDRHNIRIEIWERGAGYTLASGSSSSAAAAVARRLGQCDEPITVHMPGGVLSIEVRPDYSVRMTGPVTPVAQGELLPDVLAQGDHLFPKA